MTDGSATTLVVIDDDPDVLRATARVLQQAGYTVIGGASAAEAIELTRRHLPALLLLDVMLPDGNGVDVARQVKGEAALAGVFVILLSGLKTSGDDQAAGLAQGLADGYIARPIGKPELLARVDAMLRLRSAQQRMQEALERLGKIASRVPGLIYQFRLRPDGSSCLPFASEAIGEIYHLRPEDVREDAARLFALSHPDDHDGLVASIQQSARDLIPWRHEYRVKFDDGSVRWLAGNALPEREADGSVLWHGFITDITERRLAAAELEQHRHHLEELVRSRTAELALSRDAAEAGNRAKSAFLATVGHELRTPLNAIIGLGHIVARELAQPKLRDQVETIVRSGRQLLDMVNQILDMSRLEAGKLEIGSTDFALQSLLDTTGNALREAARAKGLMLALEIDPALPRFLRGDPGRLGQILTNLVGNAIKFSERGRIDLRAHLVETGAEDLLLRFEVEDHGIGMGAQQQAALFDRFAQADNFTTRKYGGIGIGLALCKHLAELMGGAIGVNSTPGQGSTFWVTARLRRGRAGEVPGSFAQTVPAPPVQQMPAENAPWQEAATPAAAIAAPVDGARLDAQILRDLLEHLDALLAQSDTAAVALFETHGAALRAAYGVQGAELGRRIRGFEFEAARELLGTLR